MSHTVNTAAFTGSIPEVYHNNLGPILFEYSAKDMARRVSERLSGPSDILEIACGTAISTKHLARAVPPGSRIVATDLNDAMLEIADRENGDLPGVSYDQADAMELPFEANSFDAVVCQFGLMFLPDRVGGLKEMHRVLKPGGSVTVTTWDSFKHNPAVEIADRMIKAAFETDPPRFLEVPFGMHDVEEVRSLFAEAGFPDMEAAHVAEIVEVADLAAFAKGEVMCNPSILEVESRGSVPATDIITDIAAELSKEFGPEPAKLPFREITFQAKKPKV